MENESRPRSVIITFNRKFFKIPEAVQPSEPDETEEGEHLFHSQMWVKGTPLHFIVDSGRQKNLISAEVIKRFSLPTTPHPQPYTIGLPRQESDPRVSQ